MNTDYRTGTLQHALAHQAKKHPGRVALVWDDEEYTWEELFLESLAMAEALTDARVGAGQIVATWGTSAPFHVVSLCAAGMIEAIQMPLNPRWPVAFLREMAGKATLVISDGRLPAARCAGASRVLSWNARERSHPRTVTPPPSSVEGNSPVTVDFTRGRSKGVPRGVLLTHGMVLANAAATSEMLKLQSRDSVAFLFPAWQHPHELIGKGLVSGCTSVVVDFPYPRTILSVLRQHSPTWVVGSPRVLDGVLPFGDRVVESFKEVQGVLLVGDYARPRLVNRLVASGVKLLAGWGSAETAGVALAGPIAPETTDMCGTPCPGYEASVRSREGSKEGELLVRGEAVGLSYLDKRPVRGPEGWLPTGDLVRMAQDGTLRLAGRPGEAVPGESRPVSLTRLETTLARISGVADVAAVIPSARPEAVVVYVEPSEGWLSITPLTRRLQQFFGERLPDVVVVQALPRTPDGRVDKIALAAGEMPSMSIETIDKALLDLVNRRAALAAAHRGDENPLAADESVIQRMVGSNAGPLFDDSVREVFRCILDHCRRT